MRRPGTPDLDSLTERQREVLALIARGHTNGQIAERLGISLDGVKWHVREILGKLGVDSREEAAEVWRGRHRLPNLRRFVPGWAVGGAAGVAAAAAFGLIVVLSLRGDPAPDPGEAVAEGPQETPTGVAADSGNVAFKECARYENWSLPTIDEIRERARNNERFFGEDGKPFPGNYAHWLESFWYNPVPSANSALIEPSVFHGLSTADPSVIPHGFCRYPNDLAYGYDHTQSLWLKEHQIVRLSANGDELVVMVRPEPGVFRVVQFDASVTGTAVQKGAMMTKPFRTVAFVNEDGQELFRDNRLTSSWEHDPDGTFRVARVQERYLQVPIRSPGREIAVQVFGVLPSGSIKARVMDSAGNASQVELMPGDDVWQPLVELQLGAGMWWIQFEGDMGTAGLVLIRKGLPLP